MTDYSIDELMCTCIARQIEDGELLAQGINTPLVMAGFFLAKLTSAPNVSFTSAIGQGLGQDWAPLSVGRVEAMWLPTALMHFGFVVGAVDLLPSYDLKEFFRPGQVDRYGNTNNIGFKRPNVRLPGTGGIPDVTTFASKVHLYVPRHSRAIFVEQLDFRSGLGHGPERRRGSGPRYLVSDLGQFDWDDGVMRLVTAHVGVSVALVQKKTGFPLSIHPQLVETEPPTAEELRLLREVIDPLGVRRLEMLSGGDRKELLRTILQQEGAW